MLKKYVTLEKKVGETPLEVVTRFKQEHTEYGNVPASYAGRLDPMASGTLLVLLGDECKKQKEYTGLDKEYVVEVLLGMGSDTGDVLGIPERAQTQIRTEDIEAVLHAELGTHARHYPVYSSKTVNGKPLFLHALEGAIDTIQIPTHPETIYKISLQSVENIPGAALKERVNKTLANAPTSAEPSKALGADFRIGVVRKGWEIALTDDMYTVLRISVVCGTGTYMRTLVDRIGKSLGSRGLALSIHRTKIGKYFRISDTLGFFWKRYR